MQSKKDRSTQTSSGSAVKRAKCIGTASFVLVALAIAAILIRGDRWSKWKARAEAKRQVDYYTESRGPDDAQTLTARRSLVWLLIHQSFPVAARREYNRYIADLRQLPEYKSSEINNERFLTACEFRTSGFREIAFEEFSAVEAEEGDSYAGLNASRWTIATLMEMKRYPEAEAKCQQILDTPEKLERLLQYQEWDPWSLLARCLAAQGKHAKAESAFNRAIEISAKSRGTDHFRTHFERVQLAHSLAAMGRNDEALALARQALPVFENDKYSGSQKIKELREFIARLD